MMKYISVDEFIKETEGKEYDIDHTAGVQCVDGIKEFNYLVYGKCDFNCGACGYAYGLWTNYETNGVKQYFDKYSFKDAKKGDWIIWNKDSAEAPKSHVAMFIERLDNNRVKAYGQNQNGKKYFNFASVSDNGILGVLRPKIYVDPIITPNVERDVYKNQIEVKVPELRVRTGAGTNKKILGYASKGYYNYYDTTDANGYKWYKIADGQWIASSDEWTVVYPAKPSSDFFPPKGYFSLGDTSVNVGKIASFMRRVFPAYTSEKALGNYYGKYIEASIKEFQRRTGLEPDGCVGPKTLNKLKQYGFKP